MAPGYIADLVVLEDLTDVKVGRVYHSGRLVAENGKTAAVVRGHASALPTVNVDWGKASDLAIEAKGSRVNIIGVVPGQIFTTRVIDQAPVSDGKVVADPDETF